MWLTLLPLQLMPLREGHPLNLSGSIPFFSLQRTPAQRAGNVHVEVERSLVTTLAHEGIVTLCDALALTITIHPHYTIFQHYWLRV